jgi:hypothetical protein
MNSLPVISASQLSVTTGANLGDTLSFADDLVLDDTYVLSRDARHQTLQYEGNFPNYKVSAESEVGTVGNAIFLDSCVTLMAPNGRTVELVLFVEVTEDNNVSDVYFFAMNEMQPKIEYMLVGIETEGVLEKLSRNACVSFVKGTHITMADGRLKPVQDLEVGDLVLTRSAGPQPVRWVGSALLRAEGDAAPIVIKAGELHNEHDLVISPNHRLLIHQRQDLLNTGHSEIMVRARQLLNEETIYRHTEPMVEYYQILFDRHQIIYAEGIATESLFIDPSYTSVAKPDDDLHIAARRDDTISAFELPDSLLRGKNTAELLRRASRG